MWNYWDASAMVKIVADDHEEKGHHAVRDYFHNNGLHRTSPFCLGEALSAFKRKRNNKVITAPKYLRYVNEFLRVVVPFVSQDEVLLTGDMRSEAERLINTYRLDFIDAIQLVTIRRGKYSVLTGDSQSRFITADHDLARAARRENVRVLECTRESME